VTLGYRFQLLLRTAGFGTHSNRKCIDDLVYGALRVAACKELKVITLQ
jgi:hypothetical protein